MAEDPEAEERLRGLEERLEALGRRLEVLDSDAGALKIKERIAASDSLSFRGVVIVIVLTPILIVLCFWLLGLLSHLTGL